MTLQAAFRKRFGVLLLICTELPGLQDMQLLDNLEHDVGDITDGIPALAIDTTDIDIGEVVVGTAFARRNTYLSVVPGWLLTFIQKQLNSSLAASRVKLPSVIPRW